MDKKIITIMILSIVILLIGGVYAYNEITERAYNLGIQDAVILMNQQILNSLRQNGYVPFFYETDNETVELKLGVIE